MDSVGEWEWDGENKKIVLRKWCSDSRKCLLLNESKVNCSFTWEA